MAVNEPLVLQEITPAIYQGIRARLRILGEVYLLGATGTLATTRYMSKWIYDESAQTLSYRVVSKRLLTSERSIYRILEEIVAEVRKCAD